VVFFSVGGGWGGLEGLGVWFFFVGGIVGGGCGGWGERGFFWGGGGGAGHKGTLNREQGKERKRSRRPFGFFLSGEACRGGRKKVAQPRGVDLHRRSHSPKKLLNMKGGGRRGWERGYSVMYCTFQIPSSELKKKGVEKEKEGRTSSKQNVSQKSRTHGCGLQRMFEKERRGEGAKGGGNRVKYAKGEIRKKKRPRLNWGQYSDRVEREKQNKKIVTEKI